MTWFSSACSARSSSSIALYEHAGQSIHMPEILFPAAIKPTTTERWIISMTCKIGALEGQALQSYNKLEKSPAVDVAHVLGHQGSSVSPAEVRDHRAGRCSCAGTTRVAPVLAQPAHRRGDDDVSRTSLTTEPEGYSIMLCTCPEGPYLGARKAGSPCCCERCGYMTIDQMQAIERALGAGR